MKNILIAGLLICSAYVSGQGSVVVLGGSSSVGLNNPSTVIKTVALPDTIFVGLGREFNLYYNALSFLPVANNYLYQSISSVGNSYSNRFSYTPTSTGLRNLSVKIYNDNYVSTTSLNTVIRVTDTLRTYSDGLSVLCVGNSLTSGGQWVTEVNDLFKRNGDTLNFVGSEGIGDDLHVGKSGFEFSDFITTGSPFWIGGRLDFKKFMLDSTTSDILDYVIINLGINDAFKSWYMTDSGIDSIINNCETLVNGIRDNVYGFPNAKIIFSLPPIGTTDLSAYGANYNSTSYPVMYEANLRKLHKALIAEYENTTNNFICPTYLNIDRVYAYPRAYSSVASRFTDTILVGTNAVHPNIYGYYQMADMIYSTLRWAINKSILNADLILDVDQLDVVQSQLFYTSTLNTVATVSGSDVTLSGVTGISVGNTVRFGTATTYYNVLAINSNTLTLDKSCTASGSDIVYRGVYKTMTDKSGYGNHLYEGSGAEANLPSAKWCGTDSTTIAFDGSNDRFYITKNDVVWSDHPISFSIWVKTSTNDKTIINNLGGSTGTYTGYKMAISSAAGGQLVFGIGNGNYNSDISTITFADGSWHHIVGVFTGTAVQVYIDKVGTGTPTTTDYTVYNNIPIIGGSAGSYFNGEMSKIKMYKSALSQSEIDALFTDGRK